MHLHHAGVNMKVCCLENYGNVVIKDVPKPEMLPGHALIRIKAVGICGSDISAYKKKGVPVACPLVLGHEIAGVIEQIDRNDLGFQAGDRVILDPYLYCGKCYPCSLGRTNCCESLKVLGVQTGGAMLEYFVHPIRNLVKIDESMPWELAPLAEPLTISLHAVHRTRVGAGEHVVIIGAGPIGIMAALAAKNAYGATPILIDVIDSRLAFAAKLGVDYVINSMKEDAVGKIGRITNGRMAEAVVEASGANAAIRSTLDYASYCGRIAFTGWPSSETSLPTSMITKKELTLVGSRTSVHEFDEAVRLIQEGTVDVRAVLTKVVPFDELPEMMHRIAEHPELYLKVCALL